LINKNRKKIEKKQYKANKTLYIYKKKKKKKKKKYKEKKTLYI